MYFKWTQHLSTDQEREKFKNEIVGAKRVLERLYDIIEEDEQSLTSKEISVKAFEDPNWPYRQAYYNGSRATLNALKRLINLDQQEH